MGKGEEGRRRGGEGGSAGQGGEGGHKRAGGWGGGERNNNNKVSKQDSPSPSLNEIHQGLSGPSERLISHVASALLSLAPAEWDQAAQVNRGREPPAAQRPAERGPAGTGLRAPATLPAPPAGCSPLPPHLGLRI